MSRKGGHQELAGFPMLTAVEIRDCLGALGINVVIEDLTKPTPASTQAIWYSLLDNLMGVTPDMMEPTRAELLTYMDNAELYSGTIGIVMFYKHCKRLADLCRIKDFTILDLTRPDPPRLRKVLSGVMNFAKFREERVPFHTALCERLHQQQARLEELRRKSDHISAEIHDIQAKKEEDAPMVEESRARNEALKQELLALSATQRTVSAEVETLKHERAAIQKAGLSRQEEFGGLERQIVATKARIVTSPDRLKRNLAEMNRRLGQERERLSQLQDNIRDLQGREKVYQELESGVEELNKVQRQIKAFIEQQQEIRRSNSSKNDEIRKLQNDLHELQRESANLDRQIKHASDRYDKFLKDRDKESEAYKLKMDDLHKQYAAQTAATQAAQEEAERLNRESNEFEQKTAAFVREREVHLTELVKEYMLLQRQMEEYMDAMTHKLQLPLQV